MSDSSEDFITLVASPAVAAASVLSVAPGAAQKGTNANQGTQNKRKKTKIAYVAEKSRQVTFLKQKNGILQKAMTWVFSSDP